MDLKESLNNASLIHWIIGISLTIILTIGSFLGFIGRFITLQFRFARNLKRKIYFLKITDAKNLQAERDALKQIKIFNVENEIKNISNDLKVLHNIDNHSAFVVGYDPSFRKYDELIKLASDRKIPVIIFAKQGEIKDSKHWDVFNSYICCDVANTTNRILVILLNTLMVI